MCRYLVLVLVSNLLEHCFVDNFTSLNPRYLLVTMILFCSLMELNLAFMNLSVCLPLIAFRGHLSDYYVVGPGLENMVMVRLRAIHFFKCLKCLDLLGAFKKQFLVSTHLSYHYLFPCFQIPSYRSSAKHDQKLRYLFCFQSSACFPRQSREVIHLIFKCRCSHWSSRLKYPKLILIN